jgi:hypothetical protein
VNRYRLTAVGLHLARQAVTMTWPVQEFLALLTDGEQDLRYWREEFGKLLEPLHLTKG